EHRPQWFQHLRTEISRFVAKSAHPDSASRLLRALFIDVPAFGSYNWDPGADSELDFDGIFQRYYSESRVPDLFDKLSRKLTELAEHPDLDSRYALHALEQTISVLRKNVRKGYFSAQGAYHIARIFL